VYAVSIRLRCLGKATRTMNNAERIKGSNDLLWKGL
jgi:hypothetical protein